MRRYLISWLIYLKSDLRLSEMLESTRLSLCESLKKEHWDLPSEFFMDLKDDAKIFKVYDHDTTQISSIKKALNALENAREGIEKVESIDMSPDRTGVSIAAKIVQTIYSNIGQVFHAFNEINHLSPVLKSMFSYEISKLHEISSILINSFHENRHQFHFDTKAVYEIGRVIRKTKEVSDKTQSQVVITTIKKVGKLFNDALYYLQEGQDSIKEESHHRTKVKIERTIKDLEQLFEKGDISHGLFINIRSMLNILKFSVQSINLIHESNKLAQGQLKTHLDTLRESILPELFVSLTEYETKLQLKMGSLTEQISPYIKTIDSLMATTVTELQNIDISIDSSAKKTSTQVVAKLLTGESLRAANTKTRTPDIIMDSYESDISFQHSILEKLRISSHESTQKCELSGIISDQCEEFFKLVDEVASDAGKYAGNLSSATPKNKIRMYQLLGSAQKGIVNETSIGFFNNVYDQLTPSIKDLFHYLLNEDLNDAALDQLSRLISEKRRLDAEFYNNNPFIKELIYSDLYTDEEIASLPERIRTARSASYSVVSGALTWAFDQVKTIVNPIAYVDTAGALMDVQKKITSSLKQSHMSDLHHRSRVNEVYSMLQSQFQLTIDKTSLSPRLKLEIQRNELSEIRKFIEEYESDDKRPSLDTYPKHLHELLSLDLPIIKDKAEALSKENKDIQIKSKRNHQHHLKAYIPDIVDSTTLIEDSLLTEVSKLNLSEKLKSTKQDIKLRLKKMLRSDIVPILDAEFTDLVSLSTIPPTHKLYASMFFHLNRIESGLEDIEKLYLSESASNVVSETHFTVKLIMGLFAKIQSSTSALIQLKSHPSLNTLVQEVEVILKPYTKLLAQGMGSTSDEERIELTERVDIIKVWQEQQAFVKLSQMPGKSIAIQTEPTDDLPAIPQEQYMEYETYMALSTKEKLENVHKLSFESQIKLLTDLPTLINPRVGKKTDPALIQRGKDLTDLVASSPLNMLTQTQSIKIFKDALGEFIKAAINIPTAGFDAYKDRCNQLLASLSHISDVASIEVGMKLDTETPFQSLVDGIEQFNINLARSTESIDLWNSIYVAKSINQYDSRLKTLQEMADEMSPEKYERELEVITSNFSILKGLTDLGKEEQQHTFLSTYQSLQKWLFRIDPVFDIPYYLRELQEKKDFETEKTKILGLEDTLIRYMGYQIEENSPGSTKHEQIIAAMSKIREKGAYHKEEILKSSIEALAHRIDADLNYRFPSCMYPDSKKRAEDNLKSTIDQLKQLAPQIIYSEKPNELYQQELKKAIAQCKHLQSEAQTIINVQNGVEKIKAAIKDFNPELEYISSLNDAFDAIIREINLFSTKTSEEKFLQLKDSDAYIKFEAHLKIDDLLKSLKKEEQTPELLKCINSWKELLHSPDKTAEETLKMLREKITKDTKINGVKSSGFMQKIIELLNWIDQKIRRFFKLAPKPSIDDKVINLNTELNDLTLKKGPK